MFRDDGGSGVTSSTISTAETKRRRRWKGTNVCCSRAFLGRRIFRETVSWMSGLPGACKAGLAALMVLMVPQRLLGGSDTRVFGGEDVWEIWVICK